MRSVQKYVFAGLGIGAILGLSTGVAVGGSAYNGVFIFGPLGAFGGWLFARGHVADPAPGGQTPPAESERTTEEAEGSNSIFVVCFELLASVWNFHIELLRLTQLLPVFVERPWLFFVLAVLVSLIFPPFLAIYFFVYLGAAHFGLSEETEYRAVIKRK